MIVYVQETRRDLSKATFYSRICLCLFSLPIFWQDVCPVVLCAWPPSLRSTGTPGRMATVLVPVLEIILKYFGINSMMYACENEVIYLFA